MVPLRPLGFGEVLDGAFSCVQRYPKIMLGLAAIVVTGVTILVFLVMFLGAGSLFPTENDVAVNAIGGARGVAAVISLLATIILYLVATLALTGMITVTTSFGVLGKPAPIGEVWQVTRPKLWRLIGVSLLIGLLMLVGLGGAVAAIAGLVYLAGLVSTALAIAVGVLLGIATLVVTVLISVRLMLAPAAVVLETRPADPNLPDGDQRRLGVFASLRRSWSLVRGRTLRTFGIIFVANLIAGVISSILQYGFLFLAAGVAAAVGAATSSAALSTALSVTISSIGIVGATVVQLAFLSSINALIYIDARMRTEGLDLELAGLAAEGRTTAAAHPWAVR